VHDVSPTIRALAAPAWAAVEAGAVAIGDVVEGTDAVVAQEAEAVGLRKPTSAVGVGSWAIGPENVARRLRKIKPMRSRMKRHP
jgi:hypothetical protein